MVRKMSNLLMSLRTLVSLKQAGKSSNFQMSLRTGVSPVSAAKPCTIQMSLWTRVRGKTWVCKRILTNINIGYIFQKSVANSLLSSNLSLHSCCCGTFFQALKAFLPNSSLPQTSGASKIYPF